MSSNHLILSPSSPPFLNHSQHQGLFQEVGSSHQWPKYWSFRFSINPSMNIQDWFPLGLTGLISRVQGTLENLFQHHILKTSPLQCSPFFMVQLSHPYMTTSKTIALTIQTFVGKAMPLLFNKPSRFTLAFLPRSLDLVAQSCPTLCNPMDYSPPDSPVPGDSPGKNTGVGCSFLLQGFQGASIFWFHGCNHHLQWFYIPRK